MKLEYMGVAEQISSILDFSINFMVVRYVAQSSTAQIVEGFRHNRKRKSYPNPIGLILIAELSIEGLYRVQNYFAFD